MKTEPKLSDRNAAETIDSRPVLPHPVPVAYRFGSYVMFEWDGSISLVKKGLPPIIMDRDGEIREVRVS